MAKELAHSHGEERKFTATVSSPSDVKRVLSIRVPKEELEHEREHVIAELRRDLKVPGFRKGKVPRKYVEKNYAEAIHNDAVRNLLPQVYHEALEREGIRPVGDPRFDKVEAKEGSDVTFDVTVEVRPEIKVDGYKGLKVKVKRHEVTDAQVQETLEQLQQRMSTLIVVDRPVRENDVVLIDYGPVDDAGEVVAESLAKNYPIDLGGGTVLAELREGIVGMEINETKTISVRYPDDFPEKGMAGQMKTFQVTLKEVKERRVPELDDEFARRAGEQFADLAALRKQIHEDLVQDQEKRYLHDVEEAIIDRLIDKNRFGVPDAMVDNYLASVLEEDRRRRPQVADEEARVREVREHFQEAAVRTIKKYFIIEAVAKQEGVTVSNEDVDAKISELAAGGGDEADRIKQYFAHPERRRSLQSDLRDRKVMEFLREAAEVKTA